MEKHVIVGLMIPVVFFGFTGMVKSLVKKELLFSNFYLGIDISLAALANGLVNIVDEVHRMEYTHISGDEFGNEMFYSGIFILVSIGALLLAMTLHQKFEVLEDGEDGNQKTKRGIWLGVVGNILGGAVLAMFIYMKLRRLI